MASIMSMVKVILANKAIILGVLFGLSEVLALIPGIEANSVFQAIFNGLKALKSKLGGSDLSDSLPPAPPAPPSAGK